jgi:hypothetical protein
VQEIGALIGWHPEALRLAAIEGREIGWEGMSGEIQAGRLPWAEVKLLMKQWARLPVDQQGWLTELIKGVATGAQFTPREAAHFWEVDVTVANWRLWHLERCGFVESSPEANPTLHQWQVAPFAYLVLTQHGL